jgi:hypothetical protein
MDRRLQGLLREWQETGEVQAGVAFLRARLQAGTLAWGSVEAAAFLGQEVAAGLIGEDQLAIRRPGKAAVKALIRGLWQLAPSPELELRLVLGVAHVRTKAMLSEFKTALVVGLDALDGAPAAIAEIEAMLTLVRVHFPVEFGDAFTRDLILDALVRVAERVGVGSVQPPPTPGELVERALLMVQGVSSGVDAHRGVDRALLPWLLTREDEDPGDVEPDVAACRARRLGAQDPEEIFHGGPMDAALATELSEILHRPGRWFPVRYGWLIHAYYRALGWTETRDEDSALAFEAPSGRRRLRVLGLKSDIQERQPDGSWLVKPTLRGLTIWNKALGEPLRRAAEAALAGGD